jgi:hypothetical protein
MLLRRLALILAAAAFAASCAANPVAGPGTRSIEGVYTVQTPIQWTRLQRESRHEKLELWTWEGGYADQLAFVTGLAPGEPLAPGWEPRYGAGMTPQSIARFVVNSHVLHGGFTNARVERVWSAPFGEVEGFRFDFGYTTGINVRVHALGAGAVKDGSLYLIYLTAADKARFDELRPVVEQIMDSATF